MTTLPLRVSADVYLEDLAYYLAGQIGEDDLIKFVMTLDERISNIRFTEKLFDRLGDVIIAEHKGEMDCE